MIAATITITDITKTPLSLAQLLQAGATTTGYTVVVNGNGSNLGTPSIFTTCSYLSIQASNGNTTTVIYIGGPTVKTDGSVQSRELLKGETVTYQPSQLSINLQELYLTASANTGKVNIEAHNG